MGVREQSGHEVRVIDADGHAWEYPIQIYDRYLPPDLRGKLFCNGIDPNGHHRLLFDGMLSLAYQTGPVPDEIIVREGLLKPTNGQPILVTGAGGRAPFDKVKPGHPETPEGRIQDMDLEGIDVMVMFPTVGSRANATKKLDLSIALARAENDLLADYARSFPNRIKPVIVLPLAEPTPACVDACLRELDRSASDLRPAVMFPPSIHKTNLDHPVFYPLYAEIERLGLPIGIHWAAGAHFPGIEDRFKPEHFFLGHAIGFPVESMIALGSILYGGMLDRFPRLRWIILESGCGWLYYFMERLDEHYEMIPELAPDMKKWPHDYMKSGLIYYSCDPDEESLPFIIEMLGEDIILYASDYPHWDGRFPETVSLLVRNPKLTTIQKRKILGENAARLYGL